MKKLVSVVSVSLLFLLLPVCSAWSTQSFDNAHVTSESVDNNPPDWATGSYRGVIGYTNMMGRPGRYQGYIAGYYENSEFKGKFVGVLARKNTTEPAGFIRGYTAGPFMIGFIADASSDRARPVVGIGLRNETHVYYRMMGLVGPTFYLACRYNPF